MSLQRANPEAKQTTAQIEQAFPRLTSEMMSRLQPYGTEIVFEAKDVLFRRGDRGVDLFIVMQGEVEIYEQEGAEQRFVVATVAERQFTGELDLMNDRATLLDCSAVVKSRILRIPRSDVQRMMRAETQAADLILQAWIARRTGLVDFARGGVTLIGVPQSAECTRLQRFLMRNGYPHRLLDPGAETATEHWMRKMDIRPEHLPVAILSGSRILRNPLITELADQLGMTEVHDLAVIYDVAVVGAGPAGLAAAVYAASEGLTTVVIEGNAPGGQAGTSSRIENYLGFPLGISGQELADRAQVQAQKFGARLAISREVADLEADGLDYRLVLEDGTGILTRSVVVATGACYRKLDVPNYTRFEGCGVHYAATPMEAARCRGLEVVVVGGGNSAGQAASFLCQSASHVHLLFRGANLKDSMSDYLIQRLQASDRITLHPHTAVCSLDGADGLNSVTWRDGRSGCDQTHGIANLFIMIGATPNTSWLQGRLILDDKGFVCTGVSVDTEQSPFSTADPGIFAVGDVRSGSTKRVASAAGEGAGVVAEVHRYLSTERERCHRLTMPAAAALPALLQHP